MDGDNTKQSDLEGLSVTFDASAKPFISVDVERYQSYLDDAEMTDEQKEAFLQNMWQIIVGFVELGFGVHPLQEVCGKDVKSGARSPTGAFGAVCSDEPQNEEETPGLSP